MGFHKGKSGDPVKRGIGALAVLGGGGQEAFPVRPNCQVPDD